jgi:hypothetical protein
MKTPVALAAGVFLCLEFAKRSTEYLAALWAFR